jgi:hypothetical protein
VALKPTNKEINMPNWCENKLSVWHDAESINKLEAAFEAGKPFETFMPIPDGLVIEKILEGVDEAEWDTIKKQQEELNLAKHGFKSWYDWCVENWGTKWDASAQIYVATKESEWIEVDFETAWGPPIGFYKHLEFIGFKVRGMYYEPGSGFAGIYEDGQDKRWNDLSADNLDQHLIECFAIPIDDADGDGDGGDAGGDADGGGDGDE